MPVTWCDNQFGKNGIRAYFIVIGAILCPLFCTALFLLRYEYKFHHMPPVPPIGACAIVGIVFLYIEIMTVKMILDGRRILQTITLEGESISGKSFFGRKIHFSISDIKSIDYYPFTKEIEYSHFLDAKSKIPGIDIGLNNSERCRVSPKMENFSEMVKTLKKKMDEQ